MKHIQKVKCSHCGRFTIGGVSDVKEIDIGIENLLALIYIKDVHCAAAIGEVCDEELDKSGALLGRVRECARIMRINNVPSRLGIDGQEEVRGFNEAAYK